MLQTVVLSSRNRKKAQEIAEILQPHGIVVTSIADFPQVGEIEEDGATFADNAAKKAREAALKIGHWVIGEDSGLMVDALQGAPGVYSARYAGEPANDDNNNNKLMQELQGIPAEKRGAGYICTIALSNPRGEIVVRAEGRCRGVMLQAPQGTNGFGYDPYFLIPEFHKTFGELSARVKHQLSHRARAFAQFIPELVRTLNAQTPHAGDGNSSSAARA